MKINLAKIALFTIFLASIESCKAQTGQTVTLTLTEPPGAFGVINVTNFQVPSNVVAQISSAYIPAGNNYSGYIRVTFNGTSSTLGPVYGAISQPLPTCVGPATISLVATNTGTLSYSVSSFCTIQTTSSLNFTPSSSVVIPNDGGGPVTIILESSTDLINWVPAEPGTYGTTSSNRFFRVRAQR